MNKKKISHLNTKNDEIHIKIPYQLSYDWDYFLSFQSKRLIHSVESIDGITYSRNIIFNDIYGKFRIFPDNKGFNIFLSKNFLPVLPEILRQISSMFDLNSNIALIENHLSSAYPSLMIKKGFHIPGVFCPFEAGVRAICGQQVSVAAATNLLNQFTNLFLRVDQYGNTYFPLPSDICKDKLSKLSTMNAKRDTLYLFAQWCLEHDIKEDIDELIAVKGIGKWTINYIKLRAFNHSDIWMGGDLGIKKVIKDFVSFDENKAIPWRSYLTIQLWSHL
ncbi:DNA-3-methyladenine glycosylase 2 family protein [Pelistega sp. NLN82]|uniref:DNA-3-methyladenine glycosylase 2 family protein n=1 Tax=Pelistega ratti TaxID=2652177 RepID=A0A6L9Y6M7_9BURK|nr:DNA-3-methyladenine glycosylase 2 family protein [Pelistega ratti]NEN75448.1 DNA-3-methyladenine glycosylase 2 family protein [Pelistega ratti]